MVNNNIMKKIITIIAIAITTITYGQETEKERLLSTFFEIFESINENDYVKTKKLINEDYMKSVAKYKSDLNYLIDLEKKIDYKDLRYSVTINEEEKQYRIWTSFSTGYSLDFDFEKKQGKYILICIHP